LFSGEEVFKKSNVLSGGEKVRCMLSRMMLTEGNVLMLNDPTNHLDLETITALNNSLINFKGNILFASNDHTFTQSIANRIIEIGPSGFVDSLKEFDEYIKDESIQTQRAAIV
jgi:ATPase subunit of ABC transporter with duplicated ATPase domains